MLNVLFFVKCFMVVVIFQLSTEHSRDWQGHMFCFKLRIIILWPEFYVGSTFVILHIYLRQRFKKKGLFEPFIRTHENHDIAIAMSSSLADPVLGLIILQGWLGAFKCLILTTNERVGWSLHWQEAFKCLIRSHCTAIITGQSCVV